MIVACMAVCASVFRRRCTVDAQCWVNWQLEWSHLVPGPLVMRIFIGPHNLERHFQMLYLPTKLVSFGMGRFLFVLFLASRKYWSRNSNNDSKCLSTCLLLLCHSIIVLSSCLFFTTFFAFVGRCFQCTDWKQRPTKAKNVVKNTQLDNTIME